MRPKKRFDPSIDRRIIEGMLHDRSALIAEMRDLGVSKRDVLLRAAELGLNEQLIKQARDVSAELTTKQRRRHDPIKSIASRTCLGCDEVFLSYGPSNRFCARCTKSRKDRNLW